MIAAVGLSLVPTAPAAAATIVVTKTTDTADGTCDADCSLREAIMLANTSTDPDTIVVPAGLYRLTISGPPEDSGLSGDLEVMNSVTIDGAGAGSTIIDAGGVSGVAERVFEVAAFDTASTFDVTFSDLTVTGGWMDGSSSADTGGGIEVRPGADVSLVDAAVVDNYVGFSGAGLQAEPDSTLSLLRTTVAGNYMTYTGYGAGIMANAKSVTIVDSTISGNSANTSGGGIAAIATTLTIRNTTISGNQANDHGGGIQADASSVVDLANVTFTGNTADDDHNNTGDGGGIYRSSGVVTLRNTIVAGNQDGSPSGPIHQDCSGTLVSGGHNLIGRNDGCTFPATTGDIVGTAAGPIDAGLLPLTDNGGPTRTHALMSSSPAVDAGGPDCQPFDQRGAPRSACDIGAYELVLCKGTVVNRVGSDGAEKLIGTAGADGFLALGGNDKVKGLGGKDTACLGPGNDTGAGGGGKDRLFGEGGKDRLKGQGGNDLLKGGPGKDLCIGGSGKKDRGVSCERAKLVP